MDKREGVLSRLNDLLRQLRMENPGLADDLKREFDALADRRSFGLNFERHVPEAVELPGRKVRKGDKVRALPPRGEKRTEAHDRLWRVVFIQRDGDTRIASLVSLDDTDDEQVADVDDLVVVAEFRDPIYPGLVSTGKVERGGDKPYHTVINAENFHALQTLLFTHRGKVDCIYIDPPYNTGAKDWKYNNDYVENDDHYRHSKWLAFMERRLLLAKELLKPEASVLIVTIDENELNRLALLIDDLFPGAARQIITSVITPGGTSRVSEFSRVEEYIIFVMLGEAEVFRSQDSMLGEKSAPTMTVGALWEGMVRRGRGVVRSQRPGQFYPVFVDAQQGRVVEVGDPLPRDMRRSEGDAREGFVTVWPIKPGGEEGFWQLGPESLRKALEDGTAKASINSQTGEWTIKYMKEANARAVRSGRISTIGREPNGDLILEIPEDFSKPVTPKTVWYRTSHDASVHGARLLTALLSDRTFPFPKSLYAVEDALRFCVGGNDDAVVLDFFAGSGTTAHAVMRLNRQDGGNRTCISVTNNEVSPEEQKTLRKQGLRPGDPEWEQWGICEHITAPRIVAAITGHTPDGEPIRGDYKFVDVFPIADGIEENLEVFKLTYEAPLRVASNREFATIAPLLWMRAGLRGRRIDDISSGWDVADVYGVIADLDESETFLQAIAENGDVVTAFIVTDEDRLFETLVAELPSHVEPIRLYEAYLRNFEIEAGRSAR